MALFKKTTDDNAEVSEEVEKAGEGSPAVSVSEDAPKEPEVSEVKADPRLGKPADSSYSLQHPTVRTTARFGFNGEFNGEGIRQEREFELKEGYLSLPVNPENKLVRDKLVTEGWIDHTWYGQEKPAPLKVERISKIVEWTFQHPDAGPSNVIEANIGFRVDGREEEVAFKNSKAIVSDPALAFEMEKQGFYLVDLKKED
jgi:hypothetical protein